MGHKSPTRAYPHAPPGALGGPAPPCRPRGAGAASALPCPGRHCPLARRHVPGLEIAGAQQTGGFLNRPVRVGCHAKWTTSVANAAPPLRSLHASTARLGGMGVGLMWRCWQSRRPLPRAIYRREVLFGLTWRNLLRPHAMHNSTVVFPTSLPSLAMLQNMKPRGCRSATPNVVHAA